MKKHNLRELGIQVVEQLTLWGSNEQNIKMIEMYYNCSLIVRGDELMIDSPRSEEIIELLITILKLIRKGYKIEQREIIQIIKLAQAGQINRFDDFQKVSFGKLFDNTLVHPKSLGQKLYLEALLNYDITFCLGPAGTGKTFLAVIHAVSLLKSRQIEKIILTRPAVEAGENLGFLPGDLKEKVDPYLRPLYDALDASLGAETTQKYIEKGIIEIAPLAYMRGRTLENAYIILDEGQNTTLVQMKMFLTRLGFHSKMVITGDTTQIDLKYNVKSGLQYVKQILADIKEIGFVELSSFDIMRHPLVQKIIDAYEKEEEK